ncbi:beta-ketoacyl-[acyl-carrier-protein] synthase II, partial [bacterium]|nr:beta-ketoacyl-[acyl-carrier-protein] synthase II [bacterium]
MSRRVVITGMGALTPLGLDLESTWSALLACTSGAGKITQFDASECSVRIACELKGFDTENWIGKRESRKMDPSAHYGVAAA